MIKIQENFAWLIVPLFRAKFSVQERRNLSEPENFVFRVPKIRAEGFLLPYKLSNEAYLKTFGFFS